MLMLSFVSFRMFAKKYYTQTKKTCEWSYNKLKIVKIMLSEKLSAEMMMSSRTASSAFPRPIRGIVSGSPPSSESSVLPRQCDINVQSIQAARRALQQAMSPTPSNANYGSPHFGTNSTCSYLSNAPSVEASKIPDDTTSPSVARSPPLLASSFQGRRSRVAVSVEQEDQTVAAKAPLPVRRQQEDEVIEEVRAPVQSSQEDATALVQSSQEDEAAEEAQERASRASSVFVSAQDEEESRPVGMFDNVWKLMQECRYTPFQVVRLIASGVNLVLATTPLYDRVCIYVPQDIAMSSSGRGVHSVFPNAHIVMVSETEIETAEQAVSLGIDDLAISAGFGCEQNLLHESQTFSSSSNIFGFLAMSSSTSGGSSTHEEDDRRRQRQPALRYFGVMHHRTPPKTVFVFARNEEAMREEQETKNRRMDWRVTNPIRASGIVPIAHVDAIFNAAAASTQGNHMRMQITPLTLEIRKMTVKAQRSHVNHMLSSALDSARKAFEDAERIILDSKTAIDAALLAQTTEYDTLIVHNSGEACAFRGLNETRRGIELSMYANATDENVGEFCSNFSKCVSASFECSQSSLLQLLGKSYALTRSTFHQRGSRRGEGGGVGQPDSSSFFTQSSTWNVPECMDGVSFVRIRVGKVDTKLVTIAANADTDGGEADSEKITAILSAAVKLAADNSATSSSLVS
jgi:hypothetical protein